jgi:hypothetical protein
MATRVVGGGTSSALGVGSCRTNCGGSFTSSPLMSCEMSSTAVDGLPVWSGVGGSGRRSPSPANVSLPDRLGTEDGVGSSSVDTCGIFLSWSSVDASSKLSRCSGTRSGSAGAWFGRGFGLVKDWLLLALRAGAEGSAEMLLRLRAAKLEKEAEAAAVVSVSVLEWRVVDADCLRRKKGRDSEKRTMATRDLGGHSRACCC